MSRTFLRLFACGAALLAVLALAAPAAAADRDTPVEICSNGFDDDGDGTVDEQQCQISPTGLPVSFNGIVPEHWSDNPNCAQMGYSYGFKIEGQSGTDYTGTFYFTSTYGQLTGGAPQDGSNFVQLSSDGTYLNWSSSLPLDAVFMKGGPTGGNLYVYDPESQGPDRGLAVPNAANAISHVEFCYDYELTATKTASAQYTRTYTWQITKDYDGTYKKNIGDPATTHFYEVSVDQTVVDSAFAVTGEITVNNPTPYVVDFSVADSVGGIAATVDCPTYSLAAGQSTTCTYTASLGVKADGTNTATVTSQNSNVLGAVATAGYVFGNPTTTVGYPTVNVTDSVKGSLGSASGDTDFTYSGDFVCSSNPNDYTNGSYSFTHTNTATITETNQSDIATVTVNCYAPVVTKDATATLTREYEWEIAKGPDGTYNNFIGDPANPHEYAITATKTGKVIDSAWKVEGSISIYNPGPLPMPLSGVVDMVDGVNADVTCPAGYIVGAGSALTCTYVATTGLDGDETLNTASATLNGIAFSGTAAFEYKVDSEINASINVTDAADGETSVEYGPYDDTTTFNSTKNFQCPTEVSAYTGGKYSMTRLNTATINETLKKDSATVTLNCYAPVVTKDASASYDERHTWEIEKSVDPTSQSAFIGDPVDWTWTVKVSETSEDENFAVTGSIYVSNPAGSPGNMTMSLADVLDDDTIATVDCGGGATSVTVAPGAIGTCSYTAKPTAATATLNTATATFNAIEFTASAAVSFAKKVIDGTATVKDDQIGLNESITAGSGPWTFTKEEDGSCSTDQSDYAGDGTYSFSEDNIATVTGSNGQTDSAEASTTVACYAPLVSKDASTEWFKKYEWTIEKDVDTNAVTGYLGDDFTLTYTVTVDQTVTEYGFRAFGEIFVTNPADAPRPITVNVADAVNGTTATVDCGAGSTSLTVAQGTTGTCSYAVDLKSNNELTNTATVTFNFIDFLATAAVIFGDPEIVGDPEIDLKDYFENLPGVPIGTATGDETFEYTQPIECPDTIEAYSSGTYTYEFRNEAYIDGTEEFDLELVDLTCYLPAKAKVVKTIDAGPEDIGQFPITFELRDPDLFVVETLSLYEEDFTGGQAELMFSEDLTFGGTWTVVEVLPDGWVTDDELECTFTIAFPGSADQTYTCTFDNTEMSRVDLLKLTNGLYDPTKTWTFKVSEGPDGFGGTEVASDSTPTDLADAGVLKFGNVNLDPGATYTVCEIEVPAGYSTFWQIDTDGDGIGDVTVVPYNPNADDIPPEDLGNRCVDFGAGTGIALVPGMTLHFIVDNQAPGGAPRTPGYWKNWNRCTGGGQQYTADANGGWMEGFWLLEDVLDPAIGGGVTWDDILSDSFDPIVIDDCYQAVLILDKRNCDGKKVASDPLHNLATHLLAAQLNFGAGACTTQDVLDAALDAEELLDKYNFDGCTHTKLDKRHPDVQLANQLAGYLDAYNNGMFCGDGSE